MTITLYNTASDQRCLHKTLNAVGSAITCRFNDECTVEEPSFRMSYDDNYINANYLKVNEWNKYYYITERNILNNNEIVINCHMDVLMSFRNQILDSNIIAERSSSDINKFIADTACEDRGTVQQIVRKCSTTPFSHETKCYVLHIAGMS